MPIVRLPDGRPIFYAHVPKCAGSAVENYLEARFGPLGMVDRGFGRRGASEAWSISPPQHIPDVVRRELLPDYLFAATFATVRHPLHRLRSVFRFQKYVERAVPPSTDFPRWVAQLERTLKLDPNALHGHLRPMAEMVPAGARIFRIEHHLSDLVTWLDELSGEKTGPREVPRANDLSERAPEAPEPPLTPEVRSRIAELYAVDYDRFGYGPDPESMGAT